MFGLSIVRNRRRTRHIDADRGAAELSKWEARAIFVAILWVLVTLVTTRANAADAFRQANDPYYTATPPMEWAYMGALAADCSTTYDIKNHPNIEEANPLLGKHPSDGKITAACLLTAGLHYGITRFMLDHDAKPGLVKAWLWASTLIEIGVTGHNYSIGLRFKFPGSGQQNLAPSGK